MKCQGLVTLYNGLDILQTEDYIKVLCERYISWISNIHLDHGGWMKSYLILDRPTLLPTSPPFMKALQTEEGDPDPAVQHALEKKMGFSYWSGIGQLVYAMVCCHPDLSDRGSSPRFAKISNALFDPKKCSDMFYSLT